MDKFLGHVYIMGRSPLQIIAIMYRRILSANGKQWTIIWAPLNWNYSVVVGCIYGQILICVGIKKKVNVTKKISLSTKSDNNKQTNKIILPKFLALYSNGNKRKSDSRPKQLGTYWQNEDGTEVGEQNTWSRQSWVFQVSKKYIKMFLSYLGLGNEWFMGRHLTS